MMSKKNVLLFVQSIKHSLPPAEPTEQLLAYARSLGFTSQDLAEMEAAIEEAFEQVEEFPHIDLDAHD